MRAQGKSELGTVLFFLILGVVGVVMTLILPGKGRVADGDWGSSFLPLASSIVLIAGSLFSFLTPSNSHPEEPAPGNVSARRWLISLVALAVLVFLFEWLGAMVTFSMAVCLYLMLIEGRDLRGSLLIGVGLGLFTCVVFGILLRVPLPTGLIGWPG